MRCGDTAAQPARDRWRGRSGGTCRGSRARCSAGRLDDADELHLLDLLSLPLPPSLRSLFDAMDEPTRERRQGEVLARVLQRCSARSPCLIVIEDLHWAPARTLRQAAALAAAVEQCPALLVTTARSDGDPLDAAWRGSAGVSALVTFDLGPLRWTEASALAAQFGDVADSFTIRCVERSGGNPLFLEQLLHGGRDDAGALPDSVQSVVLARLDRLGRGRASRRARRVGARPALLARGAAPSAGGASAEDLRSRTAWYGPRRATASSRTR